jgi:phage-related holin
MFFAPVKGILITVAAFIILDTISGLWKAKVTKTPITSKGLSGIISKMLLYQAAILATYLLDFYVLGDILKGIFGIEGLLVKAAAMLLVFIEAQSINENYKIAKGIDLWAEFKKMISRVRHIKEDVTYITKSEVDKEKEDFNDLPDFED